MDSCVYISDNDGGSSNPATVSVKLAPKSSSFLRQNDRPDSVITTSSIVSNSSGSEEETGLPSAHAPSQTPTLYAMSGLYTNNSNAVGDPSSNIQSEDSCLSSLQSSGTAIMSSHIVKSKTLPVSTSINGVSSNSFNQGFSSEVNHRNSASSANCHRRQASTPVQLSLYHGVGSSAVPGSKQSSGKSNYIPGHRRSQSHGHHRLPTGCIHSHRRTGSSVIETLQTFSCGSTEHCYERENSLAQFLENLKKEQQSRYEKQELHEMQDELEDLRDCGLGACRPACMQSLSSIKVFVFLLSVLVTLQQALSSGYLNSVITTIEKRYEIPSSITGIIASMYDIGNVITVIFVSYLGSRRHIPVWIGMGVLIMGIGSITFSLPHFLSDKHSIKSDVNGSFTNDICRGPRITHHHKSAEDLLIEKLPALGNIKSLAEGLPNPPLAPHNNQYNRKGNCIEEADESAALPIFIFMLSQLLLGCGGSPLFTLGTTYIDNHVKRDSSSMYIGIMYSMCAFGPVCGFLLGAYLLSFYVDTFSFDVTTLNLDSTDRHWVGMWWGGFLICGVLMILISIPFFFFPKELKKEKVKVYIDEKYHHAQDPSIRPKHSLEDKSEKIEENNYGKDIKDIPRSTWKLLTNKIYIVTCLGACMELIIVSGFIFFLPKYLETQFNLSKSQASMFTGGIAIPGACIGIFFGGYILKRLQLRPKGAVQLVIFFNLLCLGCYVMLFFFGCDNIKMAGTTSPYYSNSNKTEPFTINLTASCNFGCQCDMNDVQPVCGANGLTYFSPCHAGCTETGSNNDNYTDCACVVNTEEKFLSSPIRRGDAGNNFAEVTMIPVATAGPCYTQCGMILPFMVLLFFMTLVVAVTQMPVLMVVLRSVEEEEKAFALGIQFVIFRLFGYIPSPILFGNVIDSTCLLWKSTCEGAAGGSCLMYDIEAFRYKYVGVCSAIKVCSAIIFLIDWWLIRNRQNMEKKSGEGLSVGEVVNSMISLDKLFEPDGPLWVKMVDGEECIETNPTVDETTLPLELDAEKQRSHYEEEKLSASN